MMKKVERWNILNTFRRLARGDMRKLDKRKLALLGLAVILVAGTVVNIRFWTVDTKGQDIYYSGRGQPKSLPARSANVRILAGNMQENEKYATYFPVLTSFPP